MNTQELIRIINHGADQGFKSMRLNPRSIEGGFDIIVSRLSIYIDNEQDKEYIKLSTDKDNWTGAIDIKIDLFDKYFDLKSFW